MSYTATNSTYDVQRGTFAATGDRSRIAGTGVIHQENVGLETDRRAPGEAVEDDDSGSSGGSSDGTGSEPLEKLAHTLIVTAPRDADSNRVRGGGER